MLDDHYSILNIDNFKKITIAAISKEGPVIHILVTGLPTKSKSSGDGCSNWSSRLVDHQFVIVVFCLSKKSRWIAVSLFDHSGNCASGPQTHKILFPNVSPTS